MKKTIEYSPIRGDFSHVVMIDKIAHLSKDETGEVTRIHLTNGEVLLSEDSIKTLDARINHAG
jgi:hypothetical protein